MKKIISRTILASAFAFATLQTNAQVNFAAIQDPNNSNTASKDLPTALGDGFKTLQINLFNPFVTIGSNYTNVQDTRNFYEANTITNDAVNKAINNLKSESNILNFSTNISLLNIAFNLKDKENNTKLSIGLGVNERIEVSSEYNKELLELIYKGNKQFAGQTINLAPRINAMAFMETYVAAAYNIKPAGSELSIKPSVRIKYLSGQLAIGMDKSNTIGLYTDPNGRYLDLTTNYSINTSNPADTFKLDNSEFASEVNDLKSGAGRGLGVDLGLRISPKENISINIGIVDIGSIKFTRNVSNIYSDTSYRYEGQEISFSKDNNISLDSLSDIVQPKYSYNSFTMKLPTRFILSANMGFGKVEKKKREFYRHNVFATYSQGFANYLTASKTPNLALGYTFSSGMVNLGTNVSVGGIWGFGWGAMVSFRLGPVRIGFTSNNLLPLVAPKIGRGTDFGFLLAFGG